MTIENLGKIAITPKGQYVAGSYERLDLVTDNGSSYLSLKDNNVSDLTVKADWMVVAEKGKAFEYSDFTPEQIAILKGDKGDPFLYSDFTPEQIEALKVKGDAFEYSDFTPEQIALLQKPASDIATTVSNAEGLRVTAETNRSNAESLRLSAEIIRNDNEANRIEAEVMRAGAETGRQTAEGLRVTAEQTRQTNTATAIQNAENATTNASNAAILANEKAGLADSKATLADQKATLANDAATLANTKAGLADAAATNANNVANTYAAELALKEVKTNKQNSLVVDGTGTKFPTVDAVNEGIATSSNMIYQYVHSGNKEVYVSAIDYVTHTFTSVNHGLVNGDRLGLKIISDGIIEKVIPFTAAIPQDSFTTGYYVINSAGDTFQISATSGGAAITTINKATQDFSKWRFEVLIAQTISLPNIPSIGCEIEVIGDIMQLNRYVNEDSYRWLSTGYNQPSVNSEALVHTNTYLLKGWYRISIRKTETSMFANRKYVGIQLDTTNSARIKWVKDEIIMITSGDISLIDNIWLSTVILTNGTIINVYKI